MLTVFGRLVTISRLAHGTCDADVEDIRELGNTARKYGGKYGDLYGGQQIGRIGFWTNSKPVSRHATKVINNQYVTVLLAVRYSFNGWCIYLYIGEGLRMGVSANITLYEFVVL